jgi:hypothetical protein
MDIKSFLTTDSHGSEYIAAVQWLDDKIGNEEGAIQVAWVKQYKDMEAFESKLGNRLYKHCIEVGVDFETFMTMLWYLMEDVYVNVHGYVSKKIFTQ